MYKNISITHSLLILPLLTCPALLSSERPFNPMEQSLYIPAPTEQSSALVRGARNSIWGTDVNVQHDLQTKKFNSKDIGATQDLDIAVHSLITKNQPVELCKLLAAGRENYCGLIKIGDEQAIAAHDFLAKHKKENMESLQQEITAKEKSLVNVNDVNNDILKLKESVMAQIVVITNKLTPNAETLAAHSKEKTTLIAEYGNQIRDIKTGLVNLHYTSNLAHKKHRLQDGYCSDTEQDENAVKITYSDDNITQNVEGSYTKKRTETRKLNKLSKILKSLEDDLTELEQTAKELTTENK